MHQNPFTPVFGNEPPIMAGRDQLVRDVMYGLDNAPGDPNRITIFTGPRGSGKTTLLNHIGSLVQAKGWLYVHTAAAEGMLNQLCEQIERKAAEFLPKKDKRVLTGIQAGGFGLSAQLLPESQSSWRARMDTYFDILSEHKIGLLLTVDEVTDEVPEMIELVSTFQFFVMEKRDTALLMAGLPAKVMQMFQGDSISFLRRAFLRKLEPVSQPEVRAAMKKTIELAGRGISSEALTLAAQSTDGLPFMIQLVGYHMFNQSTRKDITVEDAKAGIVAAREDLEHMVLDSTVKSLSNLDLRFLLAMAEDEGESRIADIAQRLGVTGATASYYRKRLVNQGIVVAAGRGKLEWAMPMLKQLLKERYGNAL
jgi:energy-coupling factor transporter ATP-binding protein EcfA2